MYCFSFICGKSMGMFNMGNEQQYKKSYVYIRLNREFTTAKLYRLCCMFTPRGGKPTIHC